MRIGSAPFLAGCALLVFLPFVVSPVMVAFGLLLLYPAWTDSEAAVDRSLCALLAYPFVAKSLASSLDSMPAHYVLYAARTLGANTMARCSGV